MADSLERITNLLVLLLETRVPMTMQAIVTELADQYPATDTARRAAFERDKAMLRAEGVPIEQRVMSGGDAGQTGYWIERSRYELADLGLTDAERSALALAVAAVRTDSESGEDAIDKLGVFGAAPSPPIELRAALTTMSGLPTLFEAASRRASVTFGYRGATRTINPYALIARNGFWYLVGHDKGRDALRTFRVDRIDTGIEQGTAGSFRRPDDFDPRDVLPSEQIVANPDGPSIHESASVLIDSDIAARIERQLGTEAVTERRGDGSIVVAVSAENRIAFRSWVLGLGAQATVLAPGDVRNELIAWLEAIAQGIETVHA